MNLNGSLAPSITIDSGNFGGYFGEKLFAYDFNDDSIDDIIIANPQANTSNGNLSGAAYIIKGADNLQSYMNLSNGSFKDYYLYLGEAANAKLGSSVSVFSINADEKSDVLWGSPEGAVNKGSIRSVYGDLPFITDPEPYENQPNVDVTSTVAFNIFDILDGIDIASVNIIIAGTVYDSSSVSFTYSEIPDNGFQVIITPEVPFGYNQEVDVTINGADIEGWIMPSKSYRFYTRADTDPPYINNLDPEPFEFGVPVDTNISFNIFL